MSRCSQVTTNKSFEYTVLCSCRSVRVRGHVALKRSVWPPWRGFLLRLVPIARLPFWGCPRGKPLVALPGVWVDAGGRQVGTWKLGRGFGRAPVRRVHGYGVDGNCGMDRCPLCLSLPDAQISGAGKRSILASGGGRGTAAYQLRLHLGEGSVFGLALNGLHSVCLVCVSLRFISFGVILARRVSGVDVRTKEAATSGRPMSPEWLEKSRGVGAAVGCGEGNASGLVGGRLSFIASRRRGHDGGVG